MIRADDLSSEAVQSEPVMESKGVLYAVEDAYRSMREATGVADMQVGRLVPLQDTCEKAPAPLLI